MISKSYAWGPLRPWQQILLFTDPDKKETTTPVSSQNKRQRTNEIKQICN
jgi:hypothetical protein